MSMFTCARCDQSRDADDGCEEYGKTGLICAECLSELPALVVINEPPPIPDRDFDWHARTADYEPGESMGWGPTRGEAIQDLIENHLAEQSS